MKKIDDQRAIERFADSQKGVFSRSDLESLFAERHPSAMGRRINALVDRGVLVRALRGWYVTPTFNVRTLSRRLAPTAYLSLETALSDQGVIGVSPERKVSSVKLGPSRRYWTGSVIIEHLGIKESLFFGWTEDRGLRVATKEKALLDALYFYQHGRALAFDPYGDVRLDLLDRERLSKMLARYENPKFVGFVRGILG